MDAAQAKLLTKGTIMVITDTDPIPENWTQRKDLIVVEKVKDEEPE